MGGNQKRGASTDCLISFFVVQTAESLVAEKLELRSNINWRKNTA